MQGFLVDLANATIVGQSLKAGTAITANSNGTGVDLQLSDGPIHALVNVYSVTGTNPTTTIVLQESWDNGATDAWTAIPANGTSQPNSLTVTAAGSQFISTNERTKRWVRAINNATGGTTPSYQMSATIVARKKIDGTGNGAYLTSQPGSGF